MSGDRKRITILIGLVAVVGALVVIDRLSTGADAAEPATSIESEYQKQAELVAHMRGFIDSRPQWRATHDEAEETWRRLQSRLISASTAEIANARLQQKITTIINELGVTLISTSAPNVRAPVEEQPLNVIGLTIAIEASNPDVLYALVDRLENMPDAWANIQRLEVFGPRRTPGESLDVEFDIVSLAWITRGGADDAL